MRPIYVTQGAAGATPWIPINYLQNAFGIGFAVTLSSDGNLTYSVQHTFDDPTTNKRPVSISRTTTTATVTDPDHGLNTGDSVIIEGTGSTNLDGTFTITVTTANAYTYTVANSGATTGGMSATVKSMRVFNHEDVTGKTDRQDGNYAFPPRMIRLNVTAYTAGKATLAILQGMGH